MRRDGRQSRGGSTAARLDIAVLGRTITSWWADEHATVYRALLRALAARGHRLLFLERNVPRYAQARDQTAAAYCEIALYGSQQELVEQYGPRLRDADVVLVGSGLPEGRAVIDWVQGNARGILAFYDLDTDVTPELLPTDRCDYLARRQIPRFDLYLSLTGGPALRRFERTFGARRVRPLYGAFDPDVHSPLPVERRWDLGHVGEWGADRHDTLHDLMMLPAVHDSALRLGVGGPPPPPGVRWPDNVEQVGHVPPDKMRWFYSSARWTLNVTYAGARLAGYCPGVRLFEAAGCGAPVITDDWPGIDDFFRPGYEIMVARSGAEVRRLLAMPPEVAHQVGQQARRRAKAEHTASRRAEYLQIQIEFLLNRRAAALRPARSTPQVSTSYPAGKVLPAE